MANKTKKDTNRAPIPEDVSTHTLVMVRNGFYGSLVYVSRKTGEEYTWDEFGDEQEMELGELRIAKTSQKAFFEKNWFMFPDEYSWVIDYLGVGAYYDNSLTQEDLETIFEKKPSEVKKLLSKAPEGQRQSIAYKARELYNEDKIDSIKLIAAIEDSLGIRLRF